MRGDWGECVKQIFSMGDLGEIRIFSIFSENLTTFSEENDRDACAASGAHGRRLGCVCRETFFSAGDFGQVGNF